MIFLHLLLIHKILNFHKLLKSQKLHQIEDNNLLIFLLSIKILPNVGNISFDKHLNVVVFPAPLIPRNPKHSPYSRQNEIFLTAFVDLKQLLNILKPNGPP